MDGVLPDQVRRIADVVGDKLGRPAYCRKVKNYDQWYIQDPVFSFVQGGMKKGATGYRVGYSYYTNDQTFWFMLAHSPIMAALFKRNLVMSTLVDVIRATALMRDRHYVLWSSRLATQVKVNQHTYEAGASSYQDFINEIQPLDDDFDLVADLFPVVKSSGKTKGTALKRGNDFYLLLANKSHVFDDPESVAKLVNLSWPLFLCLYPIKPIERRTAALARKMLAKKIPRVCEFASIQSTEGSEISRLCRGNVQGAHIIPDALGGSDLPENGVWLCEYHHRMTEGKIAGKRVDGVVHVRYTAKI